MIEKIKFVGFALSTVYRLIVAHTILLPALVFSSFAIFLVALSFQEAKSFSNETVLTYMLKGKAIKHGLENIKLAWDLSK